MAFQGYLLKIEGRLLPLRFIALDSYKATPNQIIDLDTYRDADGKLKRKTLPNRPSKIEFNTPAMTLNEMTEFKSYLPSREKLTIQFWNDESAAYQTADFYVPDIEYQIYQIKGNMIIYRPSRIAFIGY